jgi:hypothetical protein
MNIIDTYQLATSGQNTRDTYTLASNGILIRVEIEDLGSGGGGAGGGTDDSWSAHDEINKTNRKRIKVTATINGKDYVESIIVENKPNLDISNVDVSILETQSNPIITISVQL